MPARAGKLRQEAKGTGSGWAEARFPPPASGKLEALEDARAHNLQGPWQLRENGERNKLRDLF
jgi:hypothetical protein